MKQLRRLTYPPLLRASFQEGERKQGNTDSRGGCFFTKPRRVPQKRAGISARVCVAFVVLAGSQVTLHLNEIFLG